MNKAVLPLFTAALFVVCGCATSTTGKLTQTEGVVIPAVNAAMGGWAAYVQSGKATQAQINTVQAGYAAYYTAQLGAEAALIGVTADGSTNVLDQTAASTAVTNAENQLLNLINQYTMP
jgi:hypothetical protein